MNEPILFEQHGAVGLLTLNRPERLNAIDHGMLRELRDFFDGRHRDYETRVIVITGSGRGFCAGLDLKAAGEQGQWQPGAGPVQDSMTFQEDIADLMVKMRNCPQPLIAAVNGAATGGGLSIAIACDMRIGTENARFACSYLNLGLGGADVGSSYFLPRIVGPAYAADMLYSGRIVNADEAREMRLITRIVGQDELLPAAAAIGEVLIERLQAAEEDVVLRVADLRRVELVIRAACPLQCRAKRGNVVGRARVRHAGSFRATLVASTFACCL